MYNLKVRAIEFGQIKEIIFADILELVGKNIRPGCEIPRYRISFSKLGILEELLSLMKKFLGQFPKDRLLVQILDWPVN